MAWAQRQSRENRQAASNPVRAFSSAVLAGSVIVVLVALESDAGNCTGVTDNNGNTYAPAGALEVLSPYFGARAFFVGNANAGATTITAAVSGSGAHMLILEFTGNETPSPFDEYAVDKDIIVGAASSGPVSLDGAGELVVGFIVSNVSIAPGAGFTQIQNTGFTVNLVSEWKVEATTTGEATATVSGGAGYAWIAMLLSFRPVATGGGGGGGTVPIVSQATNRRRRL